MNAFLAIVLSVVLYLGGYAYAQNRELRDIPLPDNSEVVALDTPFQLNDRQGDLSRLRTYKKTQEVIDFYRNHFESNGWKYVDYKQEWRTLFLKRADENLYVQVTENGEKLPSDVYIAMSRQDMAVCPQMQNVYLQEQLAADVPGKDFPDIMRYPGSKRRVNMFPAANKGMVVYEAQSEVAEAAAYFNNTLKAQGWDDNPMFTQGFQKQKSVDSREMKIMFFEKNRDTLIINIYRASEPKQKTRVLISILKNMTGDAVMPAMQ
jgi:hypothetical protein